MSKVISKAASSQFFSAEEVAKKITAALNKLPVKNGREGRLRGLVWPFLNPDLSGSDAFPPNFQDASTLKCIKQLEKIANAADTIIQIVPNLYQPTVSAMADQAVLLVELLPTMEDIEKRIRDAIAALEKNPRQVSGGRPQQRRAQAAATMAAHAYREITGEKTVPVTKSRTTLGKKGWTESKTLHGPYMRLVQEIFQVLNIKANPEHHAIQAAMRANRGNKDKSPTEME